MESSLMLIYSGGAYNNINFKSSKYWFYFIFQIFYGALKDFIKSSNFGATQPKIDYLRRKRLDTTYLQIRDNSSKNRNIHNLTKNFRT